MGIIGRHVALQFDAAYNDATMKRNQNDSKATE